MTSVFCEPISGSINLMEMDVVSERVNDIQRIVYFHSKEFGKVLVINGEVQHVESWAPFYHEIITHLPCQFIENVKSAMIMGGGSLFAAEELLKYSSIKEIDLVDHDITVTEMTIDAYPHREFIINDKRLKIISDKCENYIKNCNKKYDIIINDCFDLHLVDSNSDIDYYNILFNCLTDHGIVSDLVYRSIYHDETVKLSLSRISNYPHKAASLLVVPEYPGVFHVLTMWGKNNNLHQTSYRIKNMEQKGMHKSGKFRIFSPSYTEYYLYLPPYLSAYIK